MLLTVRLQADDVVLWLSTHGSRLAFIVITILVMRLVLRRVVPPAMRGALLRGRGQESAREREKRAATLSSVLVRLAVWAMAAFGFFLALSEVGYDLAPVITGLGIGGIAIGLGAQSLVKDTINGLFILGENQFGHGDWVTLAGVSGMVEDVNLRRTILRDLDGTMFTIPNNAITVAGNHTRDYSGINVSVLLPHSANLARAIEVAAAVGTALAGDPVAGAGILEPPVPSRIDAIDEKGVTLRIMGKVAAGAQVRLSFELRRRLVEAFDAAELRYAVAPAGPPAAAGAGAARAMAAASTAASSSEATAAAPGSEAVAPGGSNAPQPPTGRDTRAQG